ncbi:hypothetical protein DPMN_067766 [Dreissena polymorpha]|uniref:Rab5 n=1 Tax=Dreissena polymorpha TaxID=45954 RepID=A0A9D4BTP9_DREPO|nr:hypothetical protein DPMN_067766 [Dreissena polymorpha]
MPIFRAPSNTYIEASFMNDAFPISTMDIAILQEHIRPTMSGARTNGSGPPAQGGVKVQNVKLVLLGDQGVGKSSIALRFVRGEFTENSEATVGAAFLTQVVNISQQSIKFDIWDTAGQERYHSLAPMYYRGAQAAVVVYDITSQVSEISHSCTDVLPRSTGGSSRV